jgi:hypothetical protein
LEKMLQVAVDRKALFLACRRDFIFEADTGADTHRFYTNNGAEIDEVFARSHQLSPDSFAQYALKTIGGNFVGEPTVTLIQRRLFEQCGMFNANLIMSCDSECWSRIGSQFGLTFVPETLASFRVHRHSTSAENFGRRQFRAQLDHLIILHEYAYASQYTALREVARLHFGKRYLGQMLRKYALRAAYDSEQGESVGEIASKKADLASLKAAFPRLRRPLAQGRLHNSLRTSQFAGALRRVSRAWRMQRADMPPDTL